MKKLKIIILILLILCPSVIQANSQKTKVTLSKCVDGDTAKFILKNKEITVRFLAIDTPETKHPTKGKEPYGIEASNFTCKFLQNAETIYIEYDKNSEKYDKYNRHLAWIYADNVLLQDLLIEKGLAKVAYLYGDYTYTKQLQETEKIAKKNKVGIWNNEIPKKENYGYLILIVILIIVIYFIYPKSRTKIKRKIKTNVKRSIKKFIS